MTTSQFPCPKPDHDARWKEAITWMNEEFLHYFLPSICPEIDFAKGFKSMEKELEKIIPNYNKKGKTIGDKLLEYHRKGSNKKQLVLIHVEVHGRDNADFPSKTNTRFNRLRDIYPERKITIIVIYTTKRVPPSPSQYRYEYQGTRQIFEFNTYFVKHQKEAELLADKNPFSLVVLTCLYLIKAGKDMQKRSEFKLKLMRLCLERNYSRQYIVNLLTFVTYTITLPADLEVTYKSTLHEELKDEVMTLKEQYPLETSTLEMILFGKTVADLETELAKKDTELAKKDTEIAKKDTEIARTKKRQVILLHQNGMKDTTIATIVELKLAEVRAIIDEIAEN